MPVRSARTIRLRPRGLQAATCGGIALAALILGAQSLQNATANGDTRTISFHHIHLREDTTITYKVNGRYDQAALQKINNALRDWRTGQPTTMAPHLIDALWEVYREVGAREPIHVIGGYRSPGTNAMLRRRSSGVARHSQHMNGNAIDFYIPGVPLEAIRDAGLRLQRGGVGFYPSSGAPFVHMDVGSVRHWPRVPEAQLARIMAKKPPTQVASNDAVNARAVAAGTASAQRNVGTAAVRDTTHEVERPAPTVVAAAIIPLPKARPAAAPGAPEPAQSGFILASASSQQVRTPSRQPQQAEPAQAGFDLASASSQTVRMPRPAQTASLVARSSAESANDVINERGYWRGLVEPPRPPADIPEQRTAAVEPQATGSVVSANAAMPWPMPDRRPAGEALAYAPATATADADTRPGSKVRYIPKVRATRPEAAIAKADQGKAKVAMVKVGERIDNPWMRAMIVAPDAAAFMSTSLYGAPDVLALRQHMQKPSTAVMMTFSDDPHLGMTSDHFRGNAVVFVATVTFRQRTAFLQ